MLRKMSGRTLLFVACVLISVPLSYPVGNALLNPLAAMAPSPLPDSLVWRARLFMAGTFPTVYVVGLATSLLLGPSAADSLCCL